MAPRPRSARGAGAQLRDEILDATRELLARTGNADAVSIREVSKLVGVSAPSIYRHFADKDELIDAAVAQVFEHVDAAMAAVDDPEQSPITRLRAQGLAYVRFALDNPEQYRLAFLGSSEPGAVDQVLTSGAVVRFTQTVKEAMESGVITPGDPLPIVLELWAAAHGIASLIIAKPYLPWGDTDLIVDRVLGAACVGHVVVDIMGGGPVPDPDEGAKWLAALRERAGSD
ncbi:TetR/AcrR family transcriptional regulator [Nocardia sp. NEAU-G5]|uniref:TetR/AcrR family transcriptional regulator n=1 Tax=Nocardia albiluteola TaxID=2842303 RepID=A0ABS6AQS8_9NOCA|nr:TetR/AcrR family transcriptional regulator [Nocardia albiluteola]MBU3060372.1 TetR/AcrR family transcriptional regulator [Nocardia albiluteola]